MSEPIAPIVVEPVGGLGEMGHHHLVLDLGPDSFLVDCGMLFAPASDPGVDHIAPSPEPALARARDGRLRGLILTHGHLDHLGAVPELLSHLPGLPVYATPWTLALLRRRLDRGEPPQPAALEARVVQPGETVRIGDTDVSWLRVTHSLPEACSVVFRNDAGCVVHSGDFRIQEDPLLGPPSDAGGLRAAGEAGVDLALVDSTSSAGDGRTLPEREVAANLAAEAGDAEGAVVVTSFSSHVERMWACLLAARATGRRLAVYGRSAEETARLAIERGLLPATSGELLTLDELARTPKSKLLVFVTGSQGEWRAPLARIARGEDRRLSLGPGDRVIWSARVIPGGERTVGALLNSFVEAGVDVVPPWGPRAAGLHTSGHGRREEVAAWLSWVRPRHIVPVHGEPWHLVRHQEVLEEGHRHVHALRSGQRLSLDPSTDQVEIEDAEAGKQIWIAEGGVRFPEGDGGLRTRRKMGTTGALTAVVPWSEGRLAGTPVVVVLGLVPLGDTPALERSLAEGLVSELSSWDPVQGDATERVRLALRALVRRAVGTKPPGIVRLVAPASVVTYAKLDAAGLPDADPDHPLLGNDPTP